MPDVSLEMEVRAPAERVWAAVVDIERYPDSMENVRWAKILATDGPARRRCAWSVTLKGSILEWEETERLDPQALRLDFEQLSGDMERFDGAWQLERAGDELTRVRLTVSFEIGIPLLADMLNPVAQRSLRENCREMLLGVEREALGGAAEAVDAST